MKFYATSVDQVSFANPSLAESRINRFVSDKTEGLIPELLPAGSVDPLTLMVLVNAIYYKANWLVPFNPRSTVPSDFDLLGSDIDTGDIRSVVQSMMNHDPPVDLRAAYNVGGALEGASVLEIPYENPDFNMYVGLPRDNTLEALNRLAENFQYAKFSGALTGGLKHVSLPKFEIDFQSGLKPVLVSMGLTDMFEFGRANFSDMVAEEKEGEVAVTSVAHSAVVKVDESGAEAAAATAAVIGTRTVQINLKDFIVDRPFVFMIHDKKHDVPLFFGRILNPSGSFGTRNENLAAALEQANRDDCLEEVGYEASFEPSVSFPCRGRDTLPIEKSKEETQKLRQEQIEDLAEAKAKDEFQ